MNLFDKMRQQKLMSITLMVFTLSVGILIGTLVNVQVHAAKGQVAPDATPLTIPKMVEIGSDFTKLAKKLQPSVVNIVVEVPAKVEAGRPRTRSSQGDDGGGDDPLDQLRGFFGPNAPQLVNPEDQKHEQSGTGFVVDKNGYIVTNNHVVERGDKIMVKLQGDSTEYRARVIGTDTETDLAVLKIDAHKPLEAVSIGNSDSVQVGDWAVAIGSPFTLEESVTAGIVSALGRDINRSSFQRFIQTDAAINPGNSGGPLVNIRGEVIGVNTMIATSGGGSQGVGFALPSNMVVRVYNDIIRDGSVSRGSIGIKFTTTKPETLEALGVNHGVIIHEISPKDGPSAKAGLKANDIITAINGQPVKDGDDLLSHVADATVGSTLTLAVDRDGKSMEFKVVTQDRKLLFADNSEIVGDSFGGSDPAAKPEAPAKFGITPRELTDDERSMTPDKHGVYVSGVQENSFAEDIEMEKGDIITAINRHPVSSVDDLRKIAASLKSGDAVAFLVVHPTPEAARVTATRSTTGRRAGAPAPAPVAEQDSLEPVYKSGRLP
ncbi:MAG TPA: Do family serine endopeptidase [Bryobacteraceae bacterium]|jgi:serine protease Do